MTKISSFVHAIYGRIAKCTFCCFCMGVLAGAELAEECLTGGIQSYWREPFANGKK